MCSRGQGGDLVNDSKEGNIIVMALINCEGCEDEKAIFDLDHMYS